MTVDWTSFWLGFAAAYGVSVLVGILYLVLVRPHLTADLVMDDRW